MKATEALSKANEPPKALSGSTNRTFSATEVKKIVDSEVRRQLRLSNSTKAVSNETKGEKALRKDVDKLVKEDTGKAKKGEDKGDGKGDGSKEGEAKAYAKKTIAKMSKKAAASLHRAFLAQRNAAQMAADVAKGLGPKD